jgi:hypothetical protein
VGVNVYVVVCVLSIEGDHVPVIPLVEVAGRLIASPLQIGAICVNVEDSCGFTTTVIVIGVAQSFTEGVKLYLILSATAIDSDEGDQLPVMPLLEVVGKIGKVIGAF